MQARKLKLEALEDRRLLAVITVGNNLDNSNGDTSSIAALMADDGGDGISLREAIAASNNNPGADEILFDVTGTIPLTSTQGLEITDAAGLTVSGPGQEQLTIIDALGNSRIFHITATSGDFQFSGMTIQGGNEGIWSESVDDLVVNDVLVTQADRYYHIYSVGNVRLTDSTVVGNESFFSAGGLYAEGDIVLSHSSVTGHHNRSTYSAIQAMGSVTLLDGSSVTNNQCMEVGGIFASGDVLVVDSLIEGNSANSTAGGFGAGDAGGIWSGVKVTLVNSIVRNNRSSGAVGGIWADEVYLDNSQVIDNRGNKGGIWADYVEMNGSKVAENRGGGIVFAGTGGIYAITAVIRESEISDNIGIGSNNAGGVLIRPMGSLTLFDSTVTGNRAINQFDRYGIEHGARNNSAGIRSYGTQVKILNSTISGNINTSHTTNGRFYTYNSLNVVGGLFAIGEVQILNSTIAANTTTQATTGVGGLQIEGDLVVQNSILANNSGATNQDLMLTGTSSFSYSLVETPGITVSGPGNIVGIDPQLGELADNGGPTQTHALLPGSPALNAGDPTAVAGVDDVPLYDQRGEGFARVSGGRIDIGAYELQIPETASADFNDDGYTDGRDFLAWQRGKGTTNATKVNGDADDDMDVDEIDLAIWHVLYGTTMPEAIHQITVTNNLDSQNGDTSSLLALLSNDGGDGISLREAVAASNNNLGADEITFDVSGTIQLNAQLPTITDDLAITGPGQDMLTIKAGNGRHLEIDDGDDNAFLNVTLSGLSLTDGHVEVEEFIVSAYGGSILNRENLTILRSSLLGNEVIIVNHLAGAFGGAIYHTLGSLKIVDSTLSGNHADNEILGSSSGGAIASSSGNVYIRGSVVSNNRSAAVFHTSTGGVPAVYYWGRGGGISMFSGTLTVSDSSVDNNYASGEAGGIYVTGNAAGEAETVQIFNSSISENTARFDSALLISAIDVEISNSTISGNLSSTTKQSSAGDTIKFLDETTALITHSTITGNSAVNNPRGVLLAQDNVKVTLVNSIVSDNDGDDLTLLSSAQFISGGYNLIGSGNALAPFVVDPTSLTGISARLGPLADNGGPTRTHAPLPGSPVIDAGDPAAVAGVDGVPEFDQRGAGFPRIKNGRIEIGAFESDLTVTFADFGDAPDTDSQSGRGNYQTYLENNGPWHAISTGLYMGAAVDYESGALASDQATGDDANGVQPDDEDGLVDPARDLTILWDEQPTVEVLATNTTGADATLYGWIDFNADGVFDSATEGASLLVANGTNNQIITLSFPSVPTVYSGTTYARFRLSTDSRAASPLGEASDGEVEDYQVTIQEINIAPVFTSSAMVQVPEEETEVITVTATDINTPAQTVTFSIVGGEDADKFSLTNDGKLTFNTFTNFEAPADANGDNFYLVTVQADDGNGAVVPQTIEVEVIDGPDDHLLTVTNLLDTVNGDTSSVPALKENDGGDGISLREAILAANHTPGVDEIQFAVTGTIDITSQLPTVTDNLIITGPGQELLTLDALDGLDHEPATIDGWRILDIDDGDDEEQLNVRIQGLTFTGADFSTSPDVRRLGAVGGAIRTHEDLEIVDSTITGNANLHFSNYDFVTPPGYRYHYTVPVGRGGGIGAIGARLSLAGTTVTDNFSSYSGGGIFIDHGILEAYDSVIRNNTADSFLVKQNGYDLRNYGSGGGIAASTISLFKSTISDNFASKSGGGIESFFDGDLTLTDSLVTGNAAGNAGNGGGIRAATLSVVRSSISNNTAGSGGGIYVSQTLQIADSTISHNHASKSGGGIFHSRDLSSDSPFQITGSTISENDAVLSGGGIYGDFASRTASALLSQSTVSANTASEGAGIHLERGWLMEIAGSIVAGNVGLDLLRYSTSPVFQSAGYNLIGTGNVTNSGNTLDSFLADLTSLVGVDPRLGPLVDNGGPTLTHALLPDSPAINAGDPAARAGVDDVPLFDQRGEGFDRVSGGRIDIGAYEDQYEIPATASADFNSDGYTDGRDFLAWQRGKGTANATKADGDADGDQDVDLVDLAIWKELYGTTMPEAIHQITVTNNLDSQNGDTSSLLALLSNDGGDGISLREAVAASNNNLGADEIFFDVTGTIQLGSQLPTLTDDLTITGPGQDLLTIRAGNGRHLEIDDDDDNAFLNVTLSGLSLTDGLVEAVHFNDPPVYGGSILNRENLTILQCRLSENAVDGGHDKNAFGGAIYHTLGSLKIVDSILSGNRADSSIYYGWYPSSFGGAIASVNGDVYVTRTEISHNRSEAEWHGSTAGVPNAYWTGRGGGISISGGSLTVRYSTVEDNYASADASGIAVISNGAVDSSAVLIVNSSISENTARFHSALLLAANDVEIRNSTISGNRSTVASYRPSTVRFLYDTSALVKNSTITGNTSSNHSSSGLLAQDHSQVTISNSIVADNDGSDLSLLSAAQFVSGGYNLIGSGEDYDHGNALDPFVADPTNLTGISARLGPLADNGGPTRTHAFLPGSPAINAGDPTAQSGEDDIPLYDQRSEGYDRVSGGRIDIGAFEVQDSPSTTSELAAAPFWIAPATITTEESDSFLREEPLLTPITLDRAFDTWENPAAGPWENSFLGSSRTNSRPASRDQFEWYPALDESLWEDALN